MTRELPQPPDFMAIDATAAGSAVQRTRLMAMIGNLVFSWSNTESVFIYILMLLMDVEFESAAITFISLNTTRSRLDLVRRLAKSRCKDPATIKKLERLIERFNDGTRVRNEFNHCIYGVDKSGQITHTSVLRIVEGKHDVKFAEVRPVDELRLREMNRTIRKLSLLNRDLWAFLPELKTALGRPAT